MPRTAVLLLAIAACWRSPPPPPPLRPDTSPREIPPPLRVVWQGTCGDATYGWREEIAVTLKLRDDGGHLIATGTLAFAGRRTKARLHGPRSSGPWHKLTGEMTEIDGHGTRWGLILEVEPGEAALRGRFVEVLDEGGEDEMCRFAWSR